MSSDPNEARLEAWRWLGIAALCIIAVVMLLISNLELPAGDYTALRWCVFAASTVLAYYGCTRRSFWVPCFFGLVAVLFNPLIPVHLSGPVWRLIDLCAAVVFSLAALFCSRQSPAEVPAQDGEIEAHAYRFSVQAIFLGSISSCGLTLLVIVGKLGILHIGWWLFIHALILIFWGILSGLILLGIIAFLVFLCTKTEETINFLISLLFKPERMLAILIPCGMFIIVSIVPIVVDPIRFLSDPFGALYDDGLNSPTPSVTDGYDEEVGLGLAKRLPDGSIEKGWLLTISDEGRNLGGYVLGTALLGGSALFLAYVLILLFIWGIIFLRRWFR